MMYRFLLVSISFIASLSAGAQNYQRGYRSVNYTDPARPGRTISTDLYYPANSAGTNVSVASGTNRFPVVVFGHGFALPASAYTKLADTLTRYGYIAAFPTTESGLSPSHDNFGKDLSFLCTAIIQSGNDPASFLYQRVTAKAAVGGHSMGGGCSFLAAAAGNASIFALFNMAAAETNPSAISAAGSVNIPSLLFSGSNDCIVPPSTQQTMYNNITNSCKSQVTITGATHCQVADNNFTCSFGQISSGCNSSPITVNNVYTQITGLLIPFLDYTLNSICSRGVDFVDRLNSLTGATAVSNCPAPGCGVLPLRISNFSGQLLNGRALLNIETENTSGSPYRISLEKSDKGSIFREWKTWNTQAGNNRYRKLVTDSFPYLPTSYYRLRLEGNNEIEYSKIIAIRLIREFEVLMPSGNITGNVLNIRILSSQETPKQVRIISTDGRLVFQKQYTGLSSSQSIQIPVASMPCGLYIADIQSGISGYAERIRFVKTN